MTSLDFLYIALGGGFLILVVFLSVMLLQLTLVLRDITKVSANAKDISDKVHDIVLEPLKVLSEASAGFGFIREFIERLKDKYSGVSDEDGEDVEPENEKPSGKGGFSIKKLRK